MLKVWNACLIVATFSLALLGTFLVRSGVLQSIHAFGNSTVGPYILGLIAVVLVGSTALIVSRLDDLRSQKRIDSLASREAVFLVNNFLLVALCVAIFWGTFFPLISELFTGDKASLAAPWFDRYTTPLAILLVLFTGIGPLLAWRRISWDSARRVFFVPTYCRRRRRPRPCPAHRRRAEALGARPLRLCRLCPDRPDAGVLARSGGAAVAQRRLDAGGPGRRRVPQPPPLRRLHRPRRRGCAADRDRRLLQLPDQTRRASAAGRKRSRRRSHGDLRPVHRERRRPRIHRGRLTAGGEGRGNLHPASDPALLPADGSRSEHDLELLRRRIRQRHRPEGRVRQRFLDRLQPSIAGVQRRARAADRGFRACVSGAPGSPPQCRAVAGD